MTSPAKSFAAAFGARRAAKIAGRYRPAPDEIVELRASCLVGCNYLPVENGVVDVEDGRHLIPERIETVQDVTVA